MTSAVMPLVPRVKSAVLKPVVWPRTMQGSVPAATTRETNCLDRQPCLTIRLGMLAATTGKRARRRTKKILTVKQSLCLTRQQIHPKTTSNPVVLYESKTHHHPPHHRSIAHSSPTCHQWSDPENDDVLCQHEL